MMKIEDKKTYSNQSIACILNYPAHYRENIFLKMEKSLDCDFYFGDIESDKIKRIDSNLFVKQITNLQTSKLLFGFSWIKGMLPLLFKNYNSYILTADPFIFSNWIFLILNFFLKKKIYLWGHGWYGREGKMKSVIKTIFFRLSNGIFLYGNYAKKLMVSEGFNANKLHVIYNSLDYDVQFKIRKRLRNSSIFQVIFKNDYPVIIFTGRLTKVKQINLLIEAHHLLHKQNIKLNIFILGDGPEKDSLEKLIEKKGLQKYYCFYGACYDEIKIGEFYYNSHVCVSPGNVGLTGIHSMSYGCPVITHNDFPNQMPEFEAITDGVNGLFFEAGNPKYLSKCIFEFINLTFNREDIRIECFDVIDKYYNPYYQMELLNKVLLT